MLIAIDHLVIAVADPDAAVGQLAARLGLEVGGGGRHDRLGTFNRLIWLGDTYIELIGVIDAKLAAASWSGIPTLRALEAGGGLATWAIASDDVTADAAALWACGSDLADPTDGERVRDDGRVVRWRMARPAELGRDRPPFLIEHDTTAAEWSPADSTERATGPGRLTLVELEVDDVDRTSQAFLRTVGLRFRQSLAGGGARDADIGGQTVRLRQRRSPGGSEVTIHVSIRGATADAFEMLGCRWIVEPREAEPENR